MTTAKNAATPQWVRWAAVHSQTLVHATWESRGQYLEWMLSLGLRDQSGTAYIIDSSREKELPKLRRLWDCRKHLYLPSGDYDILRIVTAAFRGHGYAKIEVVRTKQPENRCHESYADLDYAGEDEELWQISEEVELGNTNPVLPIQRNDAYKIETWKRRIGKSIRLPYAILVVQGVEVQEVTHEPTHRRHASIDYSLKLLLRKQCEPEN